jgi:hypothetical protein
MQPDNQSTFSQMSSMSRSADAPDGNEPGCNKTTSMDARRCSDVNDCPKTSPYSRGSLYSKTVPTESSRSESEKSPCAEESVTDAPSIAETRHPTSNENSCSLPEQYSEALSSPSSPPHFLKRETASSGVITDQLRAFILREARKVENEWREKNGWPRI